MCFRSIIPVPFVEEPDFVREIKVVEGLGLVSDEDVRQQIGCTAKIVLDNAIIAEVFKEVDKHPTQVTIIENDQLIEGLPDRSVVFSSPHMQREFLRSRIHPAVLNISHHTALTDNVVILTLKDFAFVAQYSLVMKPKASLPEGVIGLAELRIKFGTEAEAVLIYRRYSKGVVATASVEPDDSQKG